MNQTKYTMENLSKQNTRITNLQNLSYLRPRYKITGKLTTRKSALIVSPIFYLLQNRTVKLNEKVSPLQLR